MKKVICCILVLFLFSVVNSYADSDDPPKKRVFVRCSAELNPKPTKDGYARMTLICQDDVVINKDKPLYMYAKESLIVFEQTAAEWPAGKAVTIKPERDMKVKINDGEVL